MLDLLENIKKAIKAEIKNNYCNLKGNVSTFGEFIYETLKDLSVVLSHNDELKHLKLAFSSYNLLDLSARIKIINHLHEVVEKIQRLEPKDSKRKGNRISEDIVLSEPDIENLDAEKNTHQPYGYTANLKEIDVMYVKGVGPRIAKILNGVNIYTVDDLLNFYPRKHIDYSRNKRIQDLEEHEEVTVLGKIVSTSAFTPKNRKNLYIVNVKVTDGSGYVMATWFYNTTNKYLIDRYKALYTVGHNIMLSGKVKYDKYKKIYTVERPTTEVFEGDVDDTDSLHVGRIVPVYTLPEGLQTKTIRKAIHYTLEKYARMIQNVLPKSVQVKYELIDKREALQSIHFPADQETLATARTCLVFEELFKMQLKLALLHQEIKRGVKTEQEGPKKKNLLEGFFQALPFQLTRAQSKAFEEISDDIKSPAPMYRLLQGDVGSGKTVVACMAILESLERGGQAAIMAPTEILAEQHYKNFQKWLIPLGVNIALFTGSQSTKLRKHNRQNLELGLTDVAIGTHALIQESVVFNNLGLVIIDEQHRFGVKQRSKLKNKGYDPDMLTMTATPIPRTLALTAYGDLDVSIIDELPPGRKPISTFLIESKNRTFAYNLIQEQVEAGHQAYIVFPLIDESETLAAKAATKEAEVLRAKVFPEYSIGLLHGKMLPDEKELVMEEFKDKKHQVLVCTTVVEVGVDVPNATVMVVENAERFGLSQLHQLRGRVGRGDAQSYNVMIVGKATEDIRNKLSIMVQTNDGFAIAERDLQIRGPGEFVGTKQSGIPDLVLTDLTHDIDILYKAREAAFDFVKNGNLEEYGGYSDLLQSLESEKVEYVSSG